MTLHAAREQVSDQAAEIERLRKGASTHIAAIRRHKARQVQLEDALIGLKQDLEAAQAGQGDDQACVKQAKARAAAAERRAVAAEQAERAARHELSSKSDEVLMLREQSRSGLEQLQQTSCQAIVEAEEKARAHIEQLSARIDALTHENAKLELHT